MRFEVETFEMEPLLTLLQRIRHARTTDHLLDVLVESSIVARNPQCLIVVGNKSQSVHFIGDYTGKFKDGEHAVYTNPTVELIHKPFTTGLVGTYSLSEFIKSHSEYVDYETWIRRYFVSRTAMEMFTGLRFGGVTINEFQGKLQNWIVKSNYSEGSIKTIHIAYGSVELELNTGVRVDTSIDLDPNLEGRPNVSAYNYQDMIDYFDTILGFRVLPASNSFQGIPKTVADSMIIEAMKSMIDVTNIYIRKHVTGDIALNCTNSENLMQTVVLDRYWLTQQQLIATVDRYVGKSINIQLFNAHYSFIEFESEMQGFTLDMYREIIDGIANQDGDAVDDLAEVEFKINDKTIRKLDYTSTMSNADTVCNSYDLPEGFKVPNIVFTKTQCDDWFKTTRSTPKTLSSVKLAGDFMSLGIALMGVGADGMTVGSRIDVDAVKSLLEQLAVVHDDASKLIS